MSLTVNFLHFQRKHFMKVLSFYDFWFKFYDKVCSPYPIVGFLYMFNHQNREP